MSGIIVAPNVRDLPILAGQLAQWMSARMPEAKDLRVENLSYPFGAGQSHETILFDAHWRADGRDHVQGCVVRIKPTTAIYYPDDLFDEQYRLMKVLHDNNWAPVAKPLWIEEDPSLLGAPFFVMEKLKGRVAVSIPPYSQEGWVAEATPAQRAKLWENGVRNLAGLQKVPLNAVDFLAGPEGARSGLAQEFDKFSRFVAWISKDHPFPVLEAALEALNKRWPKNNGPGLVWGDARLGNMMFNDDFEVIAVMDWEQPSLGGSLNDLAWWTFLGEMMHGGGPGRPRLEGMGTREDTFALWREVSGLPTDDIEWYEDFTALKIGCLSVRTAIFKETPMPDHAFLAQRLGIELSA